MGASRSTRPPSAPAAARVSSIPAPRAPSIAPPAVPRAPSSAPSVAPRAPSTAPASSSSSIAPGAASRASSRAPSSAPRAPAPSHVSSVPPSTTRSSRPRGEEDVVLPFRAPREQLRSATEYRTTWIVSSLRSLRERGHFDRYRALLSSHERELLECVAGTWIPMVAARAHYDACDALKLPLEEQIEMGRAVGGRAQGSILATTAKAARGVGVSPWTIFPQFDRLWLRGANGGGAQVVRLGPKEARADLVGCMLFDVAYFRHAFRGVLLGIGTLFCESGYVHELPRRASGECSFLIQWV